MVTIKRTIVINAPVAKVFNFMTDPDNWTRYVTSLNSVSNFSTETLEQGTTYSWEYRMLGVKMNGTGTVTELSKNAVFAMKMAGTMPVSEHYTFSPTGDATELAMEMTYELPVKILEKIASSSIVEKLNQKEAQNILEKIKVFCEEL
jgi:ligand-binding SRPBCC domain-containing protein